MALPYDAVLLDAGNTLIFIDPERSLALLRRHGGQGDEARFREVERTARIHVASRTGDGATGNEEQFWRDYFMILYRGMGVPESAWEALTEDFKAAHAEAHLWRYVEPGTEEALEEVLDAGFRLGVISNADGRVEGLLEEVGLASYFEFIVDSEVVGAEKPDPRIFRVALERMGVPAARSLYVGDLYAVDVRGARAVGMAPLLLDPFDQFGHWDDVPRISGVHRLPDFLRSL